MSVEWSELTALESAQLQRVRRALSNTQHLAYVGSYEVYISVDQKDCDEDTSVWVWRAVFFDGPESLIEQAEGYFAGSLDGAKARAEHMARTLTAMTEGGL